MSDITQAVYTRLVGDAELTGLLSTFAGSPSIFTTDTAPPAPLPYLITAGEISADPWDTKTSAGRQVARDIRCYTAATDPGTLVERIAERVRALFHLQQLPFPAGSPLACLHATARGPVVAPTDATVHGRVVTVQMLITESE